jgi:hypothetical protein
VPEAPPATSQTQEEAQALDAQIRALVAEIEAAGGDPQDDVHPNVSADLDEQIVTLEGEIAHGNNASD